MLGEGEGAGVVTVTIPPQREWHGSTVGTSTSMFVVRTVSYVSDIVSRLALRVVTLNYQFVSKAGF